MTTDKPLPSASPARPARDISDGDVAALRASHYADGLIGAREAEELMRLESEAATGTAAWRAFYVEALTDFVVNQQEPSGYVSDENAAWLIERIAADGRVRSDSELELLVHVMETARSVPARLAAYTLAEVARAIVDGDGPLARGGRLTPGVIGRNEVELIRRVLFAFGQEGSVGISREEAEVLFDLNDRTREADNDPAWSDLFVKAIANFLMAARGYVLPSRAEALRRDAWLDAPPRGVAALFGDMLSSMLANGLRGIWQAAQSGEDSVAVANRAAAEAAREAEAVTSTEVRWLADRIGRDGVIHANERALLKFLSEESPDIHPSLRTLLDTAA